MKGDMRAVRVKSMNYLSAFQKATSPKKVVALGGAALSLLTMARVCVLLVESYVVVRDERLADSDLIELCHRGTARLSPDFRALCLKKSSQLASPLLLKTLLRAFSTAFTDFSEQFQSPGRIAMLVLFGLCGITAPVAKALVSIFVHNVKMNRRQPSNRYSTSDSDSDEEPSFKVSVGHAVTRASARRRLGNHVRRSMRRLAFVSSTDPRIEEIDDEF